MRRARKDKIHVCTETVAVSSYSHSLQAHSTYKGCFCVVTDAARVECACIRCFHTGVEAGAGEADGPYIALRVEVRAVINNLKYTHARTQKRKTKKK